MHSHPITALLAIPTLLLASAANAAPPVINGVTVGTKTIKVVTYCTVPISPSTVVSVTLTDTSNVIHQVARVRCPHGTPWSFKLYKPYKDQATGVVLPPGSYQICLRQLGTTGCWGPWITI